MLNNPPQDALKMASEKAIQKTAEATGDLVGNKTAKMITKVLRISPQNSIEMVINVTENIDNHKETPKER